MCLIGFYLEHHSRGNYARLVGNQGPYCIKGCFLTGCVSQNMMYRKAGKFALRDTSIQVVAEAMVKNEIFKKCLYNLNRDKPKTEPLRTLMFENWTPNVEDNKENEKKDPERWEENSVSGIVEATCEISSTKD